MNEVTRTYFGNLAKQETGEMADNIRAILATPPDAAAAARLSAEPSFNSNFRTTCVATRLAAGHANNALPQTAQANVNCRIFPGHSPEEIRQQLIALFARSQAQREVCLRCRQRLRHRAGTQSHRAARRRIKEVFDPLTRITKPFGREFRSRR